MLLIIHPNYSYSQNDNLDKHLFEINLDSQKYSGEGVDWILKQTDSTQFFLFGEQHGIEGILDFVGDIYLKLNKKHPFKMALEMDEWTINRINTEGIDKITSRYPYSIAFDSDSELEFIKKVKNESEIWGLDQMVTAIHPYQRLVEIAPNETARRLAQGAFLKATLKTGEYLPQSHFKDFEALRKAFGDNVSDEANQILNHLKKSMEIYVAYRSGRSGKISPQVSVEMREAFMKLQFDNYFIKNKNQKVAFKMGGSHTVKGIGPNGVKTLGNYVREKAKKNNSKALIFGLFNYNKDLQFVENTVFKNSDVVLFDCNAYLKTISDSIFNGFSNSNKLLLKGNDAIVLFNDSKYSNKTEVKKHQKTFRNNLIKQVSVGVVSIVLCVSLIVPIILFQFSKKKDNISYSNYGKIITQLFICFILTLAILIIQVKLILGIESNSAILNSWVSIWIYIVLFALVLYILYKTVLFSKSKIKHKLYVIIVSLAFLLLVGFMYYWNIGGMISF